MKKCLLLLTCFVLAGCTREEQHHREVMNKLNALENNLAVIGGVSTNTSVRWAYANRSDINMAIFQWTQTKLDEAKKTEKLSPDQEAKVADYEKLRAELLYRPRPMPRPIFPGRAPAEPSTEDKEYEALAQKLSDAKVPVADIIDRRDRLAAQYRETYSVERIIGEYVNSRYDIVIDSNQKVLYRSAGEVPDITEGVITYFKNKEDIL
jgi:hypothetical protein